MVPPTVAVECHASVNSAASVEKAAPGAPSRRRPPLADAIRHDRDLLCADDGAPPPPADPAGRSRRPRRASRHAMARLQREVDRALDLFARETAGAPDRACDCGGEDGGCPDASSATTVAESVATDDDPDCDECFARLLSFSEPASPAPASPAPASPAAAGGGAPRPLTHKTRSLLSLPLSLLPSRAATECAAEEECAALRFEEALAAELDRMPITEEQLQQRGVDFDAFPSLRNAMEPFLSVARQRREEARQRALDALAKARMPLELHQCATSSHFPAHIGSTYGVPYPSLRAEAPFLYDVETFPLARVLADTLRVDDLSTLHVDHPRGRDPGRLLAPLRHRGRRRQFHRAFDAFVTSHVIPLLHAEALAQGLLSTNRRRPRGMGGGAQGIVYRYQRFPTVTVVRPGEGGAEPTCDLARGHSLGDLRYHVPLTATGGTAALYAERRPGHEDWHALAAASPGLGHRFDGARCLRFSPRNGTGATRVSLDFRVAIARAPDPGASHDPDDPLCPPSLLRDAVSRDDPYEEVVVQVGAVPRSCMPGPVATKRRGGSLLFG